MQTLLHTKALYKSLLDAHAFTPRSFKTQELFCKDAFTHILLGTGAFLPKEALTHRIFYAKKLLHTHFFTHKAFYTRSNLISYERVTPDPISGQEIEKKEKEDINKDVKM